MNFRQALRSGLALLLGERCVMCRRPLSGAGICPSCWLHLPYTRFDGRPGNPLERLFWSEPNVERVNAYAWYKPEYAVAHLVHAFKYHNRPDLARLVGRVMGAELLAGDFFDGIEAIVPVPLSPQRQRQRGYNQSEHIALGIAEQLRVPVRTDWIERTVDNPSQTTLAPSERHANVEGIFALRDVEAITARRVLIVDDVITLGATLTAVARTFRALPDCRLRLLTFAAAGRYHFGRPEPADLSLPDHSATYDSREIRRYHRDAPAPPTSPPTTSTT